MLTLTLKYYVLVLYRSTLWDVWWSARSTFWTSRLVQYHSARWTVTGWLKLFLHFVFWTFDIRFVFGLSHYCPKILFSYISAIQNMPALKKDGSSSFTLQNRWWPSHPTLQTTIYLLELRSRNILGYILVVFIVEISCVPFANFVTIFSGWIIVANWTKEAVCIDWRRGLIYSGNKRTSECLGRCQWITWDSSFWPI